MKADILTGLRPRDDSAAALREAVAAVGREIAAADDRKVTAADNRAAALHDPKATSRDIRAFEILADKASLEIERMQILCEDLEIMLAHAVKAEREAAQKAAIERARADFADAVQQLVDEFPAYTEAAQVIARVVELERDVISARGKFFGAVNKAIPLGMVVPRHFADIGVECPLTDFANSVRLPGLPGDPAWLVGTPPPPIILPHPFQNPGPRTWGG